MATSRHQLDAIYLCTVSMPASAGIYEHIANSGILGTAILHNDRGAFHPGIAISARKFLKGLMLHPKLQKLLWHR